MYLSSKHSESSKLESKFFKSGRCWCKVPWYFFLFFLDHDFGIGRKNVIPAPCSGIVNLFSLARADRFILYSLYASMRRSLFNPGGLSLSRGILKKIRSLAVTRIQVRGVMFNIIRSAMCLTDWLFCPYVWFQTWKAIPCKIQPFRISYQLFFHPVQLGSKLFFLHLVYD